MIHQAKSTVLANHKLGAGCFKLILSSPAIAQCCRSGQFVHIQVNPFPYPLLRRAFSIYDTDGQKTVEVVFKVIGTGTFQLSLKEPGEELELLGPLGNIFTGLEDDQMGIMMAGGLGIVPVYFYAKELEKANGRFLLYFLYGAKTKSELYCLGDTEGLKSKVLYSTDDGSHGFKGYLTQLLDSLITKEKLRAEQVKIFACGPEPMLARLSDYALDRRIFCELSLEVGMPCGMGTCMGCVVKYQPDRNEEMSFKRVCYEGPIFKAGEVVFD